MMRQLRQNKAEWDAAVKAEKQLKQPVTPWNPSRRATARVDNPLPWPTTCPHCAAPVQCVGNERIYNGRQYGEWPWAFLCTNGDCGAYVGLHPFTAIPLGTLATGPIRDARKRAKAVFNPLWEHGAMSRTDAYAWLAGALGIPEGECHFGWFDVARCDAAMAAVAARGAS